MSNNNQNMKKKKMDSSLDNNNSTENENKINNDNSPNNNNAIENESRKNNQNKTNKKSKNKKKTVEPSKDNEKNKIKPEKKNLVIETKIIDELPKNQVRENKSKNVVYKIVFVFHNQDNLITVKPELTVINLIKRLSKKLNLPLEQLSLNYRNYEITEKYHDMTVKDFFNFPKNKSRPIIYVKIKQNINNSNSYNNINSEYDKYSVFYKRSYDNKVKIKNYPAISDINVGPNDDIYNIINTFLKETNINSDFTCERKEENKDNINYNSNNSDLNSNNNYEKQEKLSNDNNDNNENNENNEINENIENNEIKEDNENNDSVIKENNSNLNSELNNNIEEKKSEINTNRNINKKNNNNVVYYIGFPTPDIAFDFNRYMNSLRLMNPTFKNIKVSVLLSKKKSPKKNKLNDEQNEYNKKNYQMNYNYRYGAYLNLDEKDLEKRNIEILNMVRNNFLNNKMNGLIKGSNYNYLNISSPYSTPYDERIKDMHENKKKWLSPRGFISSVNKYSGVHI